MRLGLSLPNLLSLPHFVASSLFECCFHWPLHANLPQPVSEYWESHIYKEQPQVRRRCVHE